MLLQRPLGAPWTEIFFRASHVLQREAIPTIKPSKLSTWWPRSTCTFQMRRHLDELKLETQTSPRLAHLSRTSTPFHAKLYCLYWSMPMPKVRTSLCLMLLDLLAPLAFARKLSLHDFAQCFCCQGLPFRSRSDWEFRPGVHGDLVLVPSLRDGNYFLFHPSWVFLGPNCCIPRYSGLWIAPGTRFKWYSGVQCLNSNLCSEKGGVEWALPFDTRS